MAVDKLVDSTQLDTDLTAVANAIRTKGGTSAQMAFPAGFVSAVQAIPTGTTPAGTKQIAITQNGTVTEDVAAYANAEITVNVQGGGSGPTFSEFTATASATNARAAALLLFPNPAEDKVYFAYITKPKSTWVENQFLSMVMTGVNVLGTSIRWRNGGYNSTGTLGASYDVVIQPGDTFMVCEADFVL